MPGRFVIMRSRVPTAGAACALAAIAFSFSGQHSAIATSVGHHTRVPTASHSKGPGWASSNWSGYAVTGGPFTAATGQWRVPTVSATAGATYSSSWVGIDGFNNSNLIQTGTEQDYYGGAAHYYAWWEILPAPETVISSMTVHPGDTMTASVTRVSTGVWTIAINDGSQHFSIQEAYSGPLTSAEWIEEAPSVGGRTATLAHYGSTVFDPGTVNGAAPGLTAANRGVMVQHRKQVSTPSSEDSDADGFAVAYGNLAPGPPTS